MNDLGANYLPATRSDGKDVYHVSVSSQIDKINACLPPRRFQRGGHTA